MRIITLRVLHHLEHPVEPLQTPWQRSLPPWRCTRLFVICWIATDTKNSLYNISPWRSLTNPGMSREKISELDWLFLCSLLRKFNSQKTIWTIFTNEGLGYLGCNKTIINEIVREDSSTEGALLAHPQTETADLDTIPPRDNIESPGSSWNQSKSVAYSIYQKW